MVKEKSRIIRCSKTSLKFTNPGKLSALDLLIQDYKNIIVNTVDLIWDLQDIPSLLPNSITNQLSSNYSARIIQCAAKQASGIVRGSRQKQKQRSYKINDFIKRGYFKQARKLQRIYDKVKVSKPIINNIEMELDSRFIDIDLNNKTSFDIWVTLSNIGNRQKISFPIKRTEHFNKMFNQGKILTGVRISKKSITFMFDLPKLDNKNSIVAGIDIGVKSLLSVDYGDNYYQSSPNLKSNVKEWTLDEINERLSKRKKNSKNFKQTQKHRENFINQEINKLNWKDLKQINIEKIKGLRKNKRTSRKLSHFVYGMIFDKLKLKAELHNVYVSEISPTYTSQRCSICGWTRRSNRKGKLFKCTSCGHTQDADLNASSNIRLSLPSIKKKERELHKNKKGFYWNVITEKPIVSQVQ